MRAMAEVLVLISAAIVAASARGQTNVTFTRLISFDGTNGDRPFAGLMLGQDGNFYGTTQGGGEHHKGTIFKMTPKGALDVLFSFDGTNGFSPVGELVQGKDGSLYGTTARGGKNYNSVYEYGSGTIFRIRTDGTAFTNLHLFSGATDGYEVAGGLAFGRDGNLYGMTKMGGAKGMGTAFGISPDGAFKTLRFLDSSTGGLPDSGLILAHDGNLYGTMAVGGKFYNGTLFRLDTNGTLTTLFSLNHTNLFPLSRNKMVQGADGAFYGTTEFGGPYNNAQIGNNDFGDGTVFKLTTNGAVRTLVCFNGWNGAHPRGALIQAQDGNFYGTTVFGKIGTNEAKGCGTIFSVTTNGSLTTLYSFAGPGFAHGMTNGSGPLGLARDSSGNFYGTTVLGGENARSVTYGWGTVFRFVIKSPSR